jgi:HTH-type transcriptional regulator, competence development regulator
MSSKKIAPLDILSELRVKYYSCITYKGGGEVMPNKEKDQNEKNLLSQYLSDLRAAKGLKLREVEEATGREVSNAYLSQIENGKIKQPSPNILYSLAEVYGVSYESLMEKAGYIVPSGKGKKVPKCSIDDLTSEEEEELLKYLAFYRTRKKVNDKER